MINYQVEHRNHEEFNKNCPNCLKELVSDQGKVISNLYSRSEYLLTRLCSLSNNPDQVAAVFNEAEQMYPPTGINQIYLLLENELKKSKVFGGKS